MLGLITDRTQYNVDGLNVLSKKKHNEMTDAEKAEWFGNPYDVAVYMPDEVVNLIPPNESTDLYHTCDLEFKDDAIIATTTYSGSSVYGMIDLGSADWFDGKTITLSVKEIVTSNGATPKIALYWQTNAGSVPARVELTSTGNKTYTLHNNYGTNDVRLFLRVYATSGTTVKIGTKVIFKGVMLELGDTAHDYVPYYDVFPTPALKGAFNYFDLNRIERAVGEISSVYGLNLSTKMDWTVEDYPTSAEMTRILSNVATIRAMLPNSEELPLLPTTMSKLTYKQANDIEKVLAAVDMGV